MHKISAIVAGALLAAQMVTAAHADKRPLIWEVLEASSTAYSARLGSRLPTQNNSSFGADLRLRGPDIATVRDPLSAWVSATLIEPRKANDMQYLRLEGRIDSGDGNRSLVIRNTLKRKWPLLEAEVNQELAFRMRPAEERRRYVQRSHDVALRSPATGTEMRFRAFRENDNPWNTHIALTQRVRKHLELNASVDNPGSVPFGKFQARYRVTW